jgi:deazaflavin-dependent oxidoreductase (nitroreductase family)
MTLSAADLDSISKKRTIDLTTIGSKSGRPRRIEIWWFRVGERMIISGTPGKRDWLANIRANPSITIHVDGRDLRAKAREIDDRDFRRSFFTALDTRWYRNQVELEVLVADAPMIEVEFNDQEG